MDEPLLSVGIVSGPSLRCTFPTAYRIRGHERQLTGAYAATLAGHSIILEGPDGRFESLREVILEPLQPDSPFVLHDVTIGLRFHWERKREERFFGTLKLLADGDTITAINIIPVEEYLSSVISSEMSASSSLNLLKAHAISSRSWLLAQLKRSRTNPRPTGEPRTRIEDSDQHIRWYDREDHLSFDVCADDHCQRYHGVTMDYHPAVRQAIRETRGQALLHEGSLCDTRFSKSCGGVSELFENVWEPVHHPYLTPVVDAPARPEGYSFDLTREEAAAHWIQTTPPAFCNTQDPAVLSQVLLDYDRETQDFYRWTVRYAQEEVAAIIREKSGMDFGQIAALRPVARGSSGRIMKLTIVGTQRSLTIGKELEIRKTLSRSHLYSSAFVVSIRRTGNNLPDEFILKGAGWGHGVGMCQIGAAVMGEQGYSYDRILNHYFTGTAIQRLY
ncbi:MAG: SpoIID/LytB domain-containing protein [Ignavibacteria bacterium]|nr:SpoIID/LytB domain-containing protein [Ignavibacteria bacterium]